MEHFKGIPVAPGVVVGSVFIIDDARIRIPRRLVRPDETPRERERFEHAIRASAEELAALCSQTKAELGGEAATIFAFHLGVLADPSVTEPIEQLIEESHVTAEHAVSQVFSKLADHFASMKDPAFQTKVNDIWDVDRRVLSHLIGERRSRLDALDHQAVIVAPDLTPSQTAGLDRDHVVAIVTDSGGKTSHTAILARAMDIPAVVGVENLVNSARDGQCIIVDGDQGVIILDPDEETIERYARRHEDIQRFRLSLDELLDQPSVTKDGVEIKLLGNIEFPSEVDTMLANGGGGVGLFRTEFLYLNQRDEPTEEEQFQAYRNCVDRLKGQLLVVRTMDLGADKTPDHWTSPERNPALGCRSIRYCLRNLPMFRRQLRAIVRASGLGPVSLMFPLVTTIDELRQARMIVRDVMEDLDEAGIDFDRNLQVGMMIETPASAVMASFFAREVDFLSIGTNDLVQYTLAVDRGNEKVASLYTAAHPAIHRLIKDVIRAARRHSTPVSICGEAAGDIEYTILLIGLGLRSLSMTPSHIPHIKRIVRSVDIGQCERIARKVGSFDSDSQVSAFLRDLTRAIIPEAFDGRSVNQR